MFDAPFSSYQRSRGRARVALGATGALTGLFQQGSAKAMLPRTHGPLPEVVFLNTSGGLTGGDRFQFSLDVAAGAGAMAATQTAERAYASPDGVAEVSVSLSAGEGATLFWLPQETILFDRSGLDRRTEVTLGEGARYLGLETVVLGREAMGERVETLDFQDVRVVRDAAGRVIHAEQIALGSGTLAGRDRAAGLAGASVLASLVYIAPDAGDRIGPVRAALGDAPGCAASAWDGRLTIRAMGRDSWDLRRALIPAIRLLTNDHLPRVWQT
ncbi:urease accessory protein UreD [Alphaproteobacteria bacterium GH1-50]|uniref:Urease accessory protein UreD n=1 Tax=Kangsaoukella pontilimi TaxID=2691042 RepID=A0A7C9MA31_9RHOB|nr:urease accessory protein UreD [Kangsaoukella pontilimi]MXQ07713.1 urease accessory protein UreD [Kangsaoukella pontilimi]